MGSKESPERADHDPWGQSSFKGPVGVEKGNPAKSGWPELGLGRGPCLNRCISVNFRDTAF